MTDCNGYCGLGCASCDDKVIEVGTSSVSICGHIEVVPIYAWKCKGCGMITTYPNIIGHNHTNPPTDFWV